MASQLSIANLALIRIGEPRIAALSDNRQAAEIISDVWDQVRDDELRRATWRFSVVRDSLAADVDVPAWGFDAQYTLPGDCLRMLQISDYYHGVDLTDYRVSDTAMFRIEGDKILARGTGSLPVRYIARKDNVGTWDASFADAFAWRIAKELCERITESSSKWEKCQFGYKESISMAKRANALEAPSDPIPDDSWILSRL